MKKILGRLNWGTKILLAVGLVVMGGGDLCRAMGINFFWEARWIGWELVLFGTIGLLTSMARIKRQAQRSSVAEQLARGILLFFILVQAAMAAVIPNTHAYELARRSMLQN